MLKHFARDRNLEARSLYSIHTDW